MRSLDTDPDVMEKQSKTHKISIIMPGLRKENLDVTRRRLLVAVWTIVLGFGLVVGRLIWFGSLEAPPRIDGRVLNATLASRPAIFDRHGVPMALDIRVPSLFAEPRSIIDVEEAVEAITSVLPHLEAEWLRNKLDGQSGFAWIARELTPQLEKEIMHKGIPGLDFLVETRRFYPAFRQASHVLGAVNIDNSGIAGIESYIDDTYDLDLLHAIGLARDATMEPVRLSIDMRVQNVLHGELEDALVRYQAVAAAGALVDVHTGEVIAMVSLPDFDPNQPSSMLAEGRFNRITAGKFEPASIFKPVTIAGALDTGAITLTDSVDARTPVRFGRFSISDYYGKHRMLSVPEVLTYSSNIGTVRIAQAMGTDTFRDFLGRMGFDAVPKIELPEVTAPVVPKRLSEVAAATVSFGHGLSVAPIQMLTATASLVNGGHLIEPTLLKQDGARGFNASSRVLSERTSLQMRYLLRLNALQGSARRANALADGFRLGGKTGTAEKVVGGRYSNDVVTTFFSSAFPLDAPRFAMLIMVDEPKPESPGSGKTAAYNAGDMSGRIIARVAPMLGVLPFKWGNLPVAELNKTRVDLDAAIPETT
jgi:cell division protein FtsI (penicillin-binding protein 3)